MPVICETPMANMLRIVQPGRSRSDNGMVRLATTYDRLVDRKWSTNLAMQWILAGMIPSRHGRLEAAIAKAWKILFLLVLWIICNITLTDLV